jgi:ATP-dependent Lon protease
MGKTTKDDYRKNNLKIKRKFTNNSLNTKELTNMLIEECINIKKIIINTILSIENKILLNLFSETDSEIAITCLNGLETKLTKLMNKKIYSSDNLIELQTIIDDLTTIICGFGTLYIDDLIYISNGRMLKNIMNNLKSDYLNDKMDIITKYIEPIGYKILNWKENITINIDNTNICRDKNGEDTIRLEEANSLECFINECGKNFSHKVYGIKIVIQNPFNKITMIINGTIKNISADIFKDNKYVNKQLTDLNDIKLSMNKYENILENIINSLTLRDILIYSKNDLYKRVYAVKNEVNMINHKKFDEVIREFTDKDIISQRNIIINLLLYNDPNKEMQYICNLLYEIITLKTNGNTDTKKLYNSFPWDVKKLLRKNMKNALDFSQEVTKKYDINYLTLEQQIYLMKVPDNVKEKAMVKFKEIKQKDDSNSAKAKQYLEGLVKIPFCVYKCEPILCIMKNINTMFKDHIEKNKMPKELIIEKKSKYTNHEINKHINDYINFVHLNVKSNIINSIKEQKTKKLIEISHIINNDKNYKEYIPNSKLNKIERVDKIVEIINSNSLEFNTIFNISNTIQLDNVQYILYNQSKDIINESNLLKKYFNEVNNVLDNSIYSHNNAKKQLTKVIAQWINGEQTGYCFGFEGSPGIGKTSIAKNGLSKCLIDENGETRPFAFIALGGSSNGSSLEGHSYTYVSSIWGRIVDILMESKCMNPIIYVDELDKVSKTEQGREIIGIFTHLIDTTQNSCFQDKYFSGIDIDLSKVLFIFSYNDADQVDRVLLDRIHRIKFENLSVEDKIVIVKKYIIPELNTKMGFDKIINIDDITIEYIIEEYTNEPGVRKLKELFFDLFGEINIELLNNMVEIKELPIIVNKQSIEEKYLIKYKKIMERKIHNKDNIGIINGLWANTLGKGGIIPIQTLFYPTNIFLELKLTGLQGDVMKESMNVAKTLAWNLTNAKMKKHWLKIFNDSKCQGLHIHCPEGSVSKDGPSAGAAITVAIYSLLNKNKIPNDIAITGEINLQGEITAIGGLESKIIGGTKAGIKKFFFPESNERDFVNFKNNTKDKYCRNDITFIKINCIDQLLTQIGFD